MRNGATGTSRVIGVQARLMGCEPRRFGSRHTQPRGPSTEIAPPGRPSSRLVRILAAFRKLRFPLQSEHFPSRCDILKPLPMCWLPQCVGQVSAIVSEPPIFGYSSHTRFLQSLSHPQGANVKKQTFGESMGVRQPIIRHRRPDWSRRLPQEAAAVPSASAARLTFQIVRDPQ